MSTKKKKKVKEQSVDLNLISLYDQAVSNFDIHTLPLGIKYLSLLDDDVKVRLMNSLVIDDAKFQIQEHETYIIVTNKIVSLVYNLENNLAVLIRNNNVLRYYKVPDDLKSKDEFKEFIELLLNIISEDPKLEL